MRSYRTKKDRDRFEEAGLAMRCAISRFDEALRTKEVRWSPSDVRMFHFLLSFIGTWSRTWNAMSVKRIAEMTGLHARTVTRSMKKLDEHGVIEWERGDGWDWSEVRLPTREGRSLVAAPRTDDEGRSHTTAPRPPGVPPAGDGPGDM